MKLVRKEFANRDYEGLDNNSFIKLKRYRHKLAQELNKKRNNINKSLKDRVIKLMHDDNGVFRLTPNDQDIYYERIKELDDSRKKSSGMRSYLLKKQRDNILETNNKKLRLDKLKGAGKAAVIGTGIAGLTYGGKKLYDHYKKDKK